jgi:hypothetical protein
VWANKLRKRISITSHNLNLVLALLVGSILLRTRRKTHQGKVMALICIQQGVVVPMRRESLEHKGSGSGELDKCTFEIASLRTFFALLPVLLVGSEVVFELLGLVPAVVSGPIRKFCY